MCVYCVSLGPGVYLKAGANIRYRVTTSYNVTVTCVAATTASVTSYLIISVDPNPAPVFTNFQGENKYIKTLISACACF